MQSSTFITYLGPTLPPAVLIIIYYYYRNAFKFWKKRGVAGPDPSMLVGNMVQLVRDRKNCITWMQKYGKVYGIYEGSRPVLVVADPEVMRQLAIKEFAKMPDHAQLEFVSDLQKSFLFLSQGEQWRKKRTLMSGTFTSGKMRRMYKLLDVCAEDMLLAFREQLDKGKSIVHLKDLFGLFTMDAIASCCYGLKMERYKTFEGGLKQAATRNDFVREAMKVFDFKYWRLLMMLCVNARLLKMVGFNFLPNKTLNGFAARIEKLVENRRASGKKFDDYLQMLLDAKLEDDSSASSKSVVVDTERERVALVDENKLDSKESHHLGAVRDAKEERFQISDDERARLRHESNSLSEIEIISGAMFLLIVGLETTANLLTNCFYTLSFHPDIQEKLYQTVKGLAKQNGANRWSFDYDALISNEYLDAVISETLRSLTPVMQTDREVIEEVYLETYGIRLQRGTKVLFCLNEIMHDKDHWTEPLKFDPERFMPGQRDKIVPGSYCPFGLGPRHCLGMRFSLTESKLALAKLLMEFKFAPAPDLEYPPTMKNNFGLATIKLPEVSVTRR